MKNQTETIRKYIRLINNVQEQGGLWLPNIQRYFVWKEEQIERLFDSIMRGYPIGNFLIWKTKERVKMRKFIDNYRDGIKITDFYMPKNDNIKLLVLDGQQRTQALFIGLQGSYNGKELYFNVFSGTVERDDIMYEFKFLNSKEASLGKGWVKLKDIIYNTGDDHYSVAEKIIEKIERERELSGEEKRRIHKNISLLFKRFTSEEYITYTILDSVDEPKRYKLNDVVEIFIRANSGGTPLSKSDLMFSLLTAGWEDIEEDLTDFIEDLNKKGFKFSRDFVLKTSLVLIGAGAKYDVMKFRKERNLRKIKENWEKIKTSIKKIIDFLVNYTFIRDDKALPSYIALIPLIYFNYKYPNKWKNADKKKLAMWLTRVLLVGAFSGSSDSLLDAIIRNIDEKEDFDINYINDEIIKRGRSLKISKESLLNVKYGDKKLYLIFALWYQTINFKPAYEGNLPWIDHIFPQSKLKQVRVVNPETGRKIMKYRKEDRDRIANLMLLSAEENRDDKRDKLPEEWLKSKDDEFFDKHLIPKDPELWKLDNFEAFIKRREEMIIDKFREMGLLI